MFEFTQSLATSRLSITLDSGFAAFLHGFAPGLEPSVSLPRFVVVGTRVRFRSRISFSALGCVTLVVWFLLLS